MLENGGGFYQYLLKSQNLYIGWGSGEAWWNTSQVETLNFTDNSYTTTYQPISGVVLKSLNGQTTYVLDTDYSINTTTGVITRLGGSLSNGVDYRLEYIAGHPEPSTTDTELVNFLGLHKVEQVDFITPDENGTIISSEGERWSVSVNPTPYLYLKATCGYLDETDQIIREVGVYANPTISGSPPPEQTYFPDSELTDVGEIINIENISPIARSVTTAATFKTILRLANAEQ